MKDKQKTYITLREAGKISGYAPDYIGQLIRSGKLPGKQIYCNTAWLTTEDALREYQEQKEEPETRARKVKYWIRKKTQSVLSETKMSGTIKGVVYAGLTLSIAAAITLGYLLVISIENNSELKEIENNIPLQANIIEGVEL